MNAPWGPRKPRSGPILSKLRGNDKKRRTSAGKKAIGKLRNPEVAMGLILDQDKRRIAPGMVIFALFYRGIINRIKRISGKRVVVLMIQSACNTPTAFNKVRYLRIGSGKLNLIEYPELESRLFTFCATVFRQL